MSSYYRKPILTQHLYVAGACMRQVFCKRPRVLILQPGVYLPLAYTWHLFREGVYSRQAFILGNTVHTYIHTYIHTIWIHTYYMDTYMYMHACMYTQIIPRVGLADITLSRFFWLGSMVYKSMPSKLLLLVLFTYVACIPAISGLSLFKTLPVVPSL